MANQNQENTDNNNIDADPMNADWLRKARWPLPKDKAFLLDLLRANFMTIEDFKKLPIYAWHKDDPDLPWLKDL